MKPNKTNPLFARFFRGNTLVTAVVVSLAGLAACRAEYWQMISRYGQAARNKIYRLCSSPS